MYIWVVLATFLAILASYTLSPREDIRKLTVEPLAEVYIAKLITQHNAALAYAKYMKKAGNEFVSIELDEEKIGRFFPFGHSYSAFNGEFATRIYCMDESGAHVEPGTCQHGDGKRIALITYSQIPLRWLNINVEDSSTPSVDFLNAMKNVVDSGTPFGYMGKTTDTSSEKNISGSNVLLIDRDNSENYIYKAIADDAAFKKMCDVDAEDNDKICLVYQSNI